MHLHTFVIRDTPTHRCFTKKWDPFFYDMKYKTYLKNLEKQIQILLNKP